MSLWVSILISLGGVMATLVTNAVIIGKYLERINNHTASISRHDGEIARLSGEFAAWTGTGPGGINYRRRYE